MAKKTKITDKAYNQALAENMPNKWTSLAFRYFSESTEEQDLKPNKILAGTLLATFVLGFLGTVFNLDDSILRPLTLFYGFGVFSIVSFLFAAVFMNNRRLKMIIKVLGVTKEQYNSYIILKQTKKNK